MFSMEGSPPSWSSGSAYACPPVSEDTQQSETRTDATIALDVLHPSAISSSPDLNFKPSLPALGTANVGLSRTRTLPLRSPKRTTSLFPTLQVDFDLEQGPSLSCIFPLLPLYPFEAENIAFSAFPDSTLFNEGSEIHSFRIREHVPRTSQGRPSLFDNRRELSPDGFLYGFSYFSQERSTNSKRGYSQRCIVLLTQHPYPALFFALLNKLGPLYRTHGDPILEVAAHNIAKWPSPVPGTTLELGFLGTVLRIELPRDVDEQQLGNAPHTQTQTDQDLHLLACSPPMTAPSMIHIFEASLPHLWSIWECLVLCQPIIVFGQSPAWTSSAIWWLRDVVRPIPWAGDFRPYFTIHDVEHTALVNERAPKAGLLLGVTNPFFEKTCNHWPHVLTLGGNFQNPTTRFAGPSPGWKTKTHKRYTSKDRQLLQASEATARNGSAKALAEACFNLRRHFSSRSAALLVPLNRYLNTLIPRPSEASEGSRLKPFNNTNFLASLKTHGAVLPFRSSTKQREFYERWIRTPAFGVWLARQEDLVAHTLENARSVREGTS
ncbi:hypothetical protein F5148DRAFT_1275067 [Russula earlei]|uniref:Uncharacterized protein n=1 Tax=Russula earlei TaxID=71964 RepID=A0ACC0UDZ5_9AGAM|nr:hypothetical protein F5148DRAFT_1275067 [Russula earlei]